MQSVLSDMKSGWVHSLFGIRRATINALIDRSLIVYVDVHSLRSIANDLYSETAPEEQKVTLADSKAFLSGDGYALNDQGLDCLAAELKYNACVRGTKELLERFISKESVQSIAQDKAQELGSELHVTWQMITQAVTMDNNKDIPKLVFEKLKVIAQEVVMELHSDCHKKMEAKAKRNGFIYSYPIEDAIMPETNVTKLQSSMLAKITTNEYTSVNGLEPQSADETTTFAEMIIETPQDKGVFTSLLNAGLVWHQKGVKDSDSLCGLTESGLTEYKKTSNKSGAAGATGKGYEFIYELENGEVGSFPVENVQSQEEAEAIVMAEKPEVLDCLIEVNVFDEE